MKSVAYQQPLPITDAASLQDVVLPEPTPNPRDLLVRVAAVSVNPVDIRVRKSTPAPEGGWKVLGWDAVGTVQAVGSDVQDFKPGDRVWYAGSIARAGTNSELHVVDERIVSKAPASLTDAQAAALPLTSITAWELLFDRFGVAQGGGAGQSLLVIGGAGGVGSILIQIARQLTQLQVIATASRPETRQWCLDLGAHAVIDHTQPLSQALNQAGLGSVDYIASLTQTKHHFAESVESLRPQGKFGVIDDLDGIDFTPFKRKSLSLHCELMFTRPVFETPDMAEQGKLLAEVAKLVDAGRIRTTMTEHFGTIHAANLKRAHALSESGKARGKIVLEGF